MDGRRIHPGDPFLWLGGSEVATTHYQVGIAYGFSTQKSTIINDHTRFHGVGIPYRSLSCALIILCLVWASLE